MAYSGLIGEKTTAFSRAVGRAARFLEFAPSLNALTDETLAAKAAAGSADHFEALVRRYSSAMYRFAYRLTGSRSDAEDIVQETFVKLFRALPRARLDLPIKPWLYKIALNTSLSELRRRKGRHIADPETVESSAMTGGAMEQLADRIDAQKAIDSLPEDYRRVVVLRAVEDLPFAEVAEILGIPEPTARTRYSRARALLRQALSI